MQSHAQAPGYPVHQLQGGVAVAALQPADIALPEPGPLCQLGLGDTLGNSGVDDLGDQLVLRAQSLVFCRSLRV